jgi:hypothetical protein
MTFSTAFIHVHICAGEPNRNVYLAYPFPTLVGDMYIVLSVALAATYDRQ